MGRLLEVTADSFAIEVLEASSTTPVLVDFWAPWCGPCRMLGPVLEELAASTPGLKVVKLNTDAHPELAGQFHIRSIPAVKLFRNGAVVDEFVGAQPLGSVRQFVARHLPKAPDDLLAQIETTLRAGDLADAERRLRALPPARQSEADVKRVYGLLYFRRLADSPDETDAIQTARVAAARAVWAGHLRAALETLLGAAERNRRYATGAGKDDLLKAFEVAAEDEVLVAGARRRLARLLH